MVVFLLLIPFYALKYVRFSLVPLDKGRYGLSLEIQTRKGRQETGDSKVFEAFNGAGVASAIDEYGENSTTDVIGTVEKTVLDSGYSDDAGNGKQQTAAYDIFHWNWTSPEPLESLKDFLRSTSLVHKVSSEVPSQMVQIHKTSSKDFHNGQRERATFLILCRDEDVYELLETVQNLEDRFNSKYNYDYTFLNNVPFSKDFIYLLASHIPLGTLNFGSVAESHWQYPSFINQTQAQIVRQNSAHFPYGDSESYRHMCRYFSGFFYKHPFLQQYQYYWRVEPGVKFYCDVNYDVFKFMNSHGRKYGFVLSLFDYRDTLPTLWDHVKDFMVEKGITNPPLIDLVKNNNVYESYNLCHFWSNFEIADLSIFRNEEYEELFQYLDGKGGFYYERWGDAPIHTMAMSLFLQKHDLHWFNDIGYYHAPYLQCPQESATFLKNRCSCNPDDDFSYDDLSCTSHFLDIMGNA